MRTGHQRRAIAIAIAITGETLLVLPSGAIAQRLQSAPGPSACERNAACIVQIGDDNRVVIDQRDARGGSASVRVVGDRNGSGTISAASGNLYRIAGNRDVQRIGGKDGPAQDGAPIRVSAESGLIVQQGSRNRATVSITGDDNDFHVDQNGRGNGVTQLVKGDRNAVAAVQRGADNQLDQTQIGDGHLAYALQSGGNNRATQTQAGSAEAALLGAIAGYRGDAGNRMLLEQRGGNNSADLAQYGTRNSIALRQDGYTSIGITQQGSGHSIAVEQSAGSQGIQITQNGG